MTFAASSPADAIRHVHHALLERFGSRAPNPRDPLDGLVLIILSQATNDHNCDRAFESLKSAFPTWEQVLAASDADVADAIRSGGLANQKAARIRQIMREIQDEQGNLDLSWMHGATADECRAYLSKFHGVGPKTIACVLVFFLGKPAFPVDTHVHRVTKRLGWIRPQAGAEEAHRVLEELVPDEWMLDLHVNLIAHGRTTCRAQGSGGPRCGECLVRAWCDYGSNLGAGASASSAKQSLGRDQDFFVTVKARQREDTNEKAGE